MTKPDDYREFLLARMDGIGGSDVGGILDMSPYTSPLDVFKCKRIPPREDLDEPDHREWGKRLEPVIGKWFEDFNHQGRKLKVCGRLIRSETHPWMHANIDRWVHCPKRGRGVCEIKNVSAFTRSDWKDGPPIYYMLQLQHYLHVTKSDWGLFVIFLGNDCIWAEVDKDEKLISEIIEATREFWDRVRNDDPPTADGHKATREAIFELYPEEDRGKAVALPDAATEWDAEIKEANEEIKRLDKLKLDRSNKLRMAIGSATRGVLEGEKGAYTLKANKKGVRVLRREGS